MLVSVFLALRSTIRSYSVLVPHKQKLALNIRIWKFNANRFWSFQHFLDNKLSSGRQSNGFVFLLLFSVFLALQSKNQSWSILIWCSCRPDQHLPIRLWIASYFQTLHCARSSRRLRGSHGCRPRRVCADPDILSVSKGKTMARSPPRTLQVARRDILCWQEYGVMDVRLMLQSWHGQCSTCLPRFELNIKHPWRHSQSLCLSQSSLPITLLLQGGSQAQEYVRYIPDICPIIILLLLLAAQMTQKEYLRHIPKHIPDI